MIILLAFLFGIEGDCPKDITRAGFRSALDAGHIAYEAQRGPDVQHHEIKRQLDCLEDVVTPEDAVFYHGLEARRLAVAGDIGGVTLAILAAQTIPIPESTPTWLESMASGPSIQPAPWLPISAPPGVALFIDGSPATARPIDRPAIYQGVGAGGKVIWTHYLAGQEDLPPGFILEAPPAPEQSVDHGAILTEIKLLLVERKFEEVLEIAVPAANDASPEVSALLLSYAAIASDQLQRVEDSEGYEETLKYNLGGLREKSKRWPFREDTRKGIQLGFMAGTVSTVRLEWKIAGQVVDSIGLGIGGGLFLYSFSSPGVAVLIEPIFVDFNVARQWQIESGLGIAIFSGYPTPTFGLAAQWDPDSPIQVNMGGKISVYGFVPEASIGFAW